MSTLNIVSDRDKFVWKGHEKLGVRESVEYSAGYQVEGVLQLHPPAAVTALALDSGWGLVAVGTAHGLALFDYQRHTPVTFKCTLNPNGNHSCTVIFFLNILISLQCLYQHSSTSLYIYMAWLSS